MNARQEYALAHPLDYADAGGVPDRFRTIERQPDRTLLVVILAVDR